jgi:phospholipid/cholesterol/gamma-HCH transport system ATP-binding protein
MSAPPLIEIRGLVKNYRGLRPLRIQELRVLEAERVSLVGIDAAAAEVFVNLLTGALLPDRGEIRVFGRPTTDITDSADWMALLDRFGIVSDRAVLLESLSVGQNLAMPYSLEIDPVPPEIMTRVAGLAREVGLDVSRLDEPVSTGGPDVEARVRLGRAIALEPGVLLLEHASAHLNPGGIARFAADVRAVAAARRATLLALTSDDRFSRALGGRMLTWTPASGALTEKRRRRLF